MKRLVDVLRLLLVSPELIAALLPLVAYLYAPAWADVLAKPMKQVLAFGLAAALLPIAMLAFNYREGLELLSPAGAKKILLEWPDYPKLKRRVVAALVWCVVGLVAVLAGVWLVALDLKPRFAVSLLAAGVLAASVATATVALARFRLRELLGE